MHATRCRSRWRNSVRQNTSFFLFDRLLVQISLSLSLSHTHTHTHLFHRQVLSILKKAPPNVASLLLTSSLDDENTTLLHISASHPSADILTALLRHGAEVDWQNFDGLTALHVAATWGSREVVRTLMENGANPLIRDGEGLLPVDHARSKGEPT